MKPEIQVSLCSLHPYSSLIKKDCRGNLITKRSIYGAMSRICEDGWKTVLDMRLNWPEVVFIFKRDT